MDEDTFYMVRTRPARIKEIVFRSEGLTKVIAEVDGKEAEALNYDQLTGMIEPGDKVILNTTAVALNLGSGGVHFVIFNYRNKLLDLSGKGHIMKLRYTPLQLRVLSCEEEDAGYQEVLGRFKSLDRMPVVIGELHSMLLPSLAAFKYFVPRASICYIMTDGASLPIYLSDTVRALKKNKLLKATITCGHAFGGDLEAVNLYTALIAAKEIVKADACIVTMGPGVVGTGTRYGFSGVELGENVNRVALMGGTPLAVLRLSFADRRQRHRGVSHHTLTALGELALLKSIIALPLLDEHKMNLVEKQLQQSGIFSKHEVKIVDAAAALLYLKEMETLGLKCSFMGRGVDEDPDFYLAAAAAGIEAAKRIVAVRG
ncbi:MAG: DUF3866 family protein [Dethiobacteria bacterium]|jgi:hypothetical protein